MIEMLKFKIKVSVLILLLFPSFVFAQAIDPAISCLNRVRVQEAFLSQATAGMGDLHTMIQAKDKEIAALNSEIEELKKGKKEELPSSPP